MSKTLKEIVEGIKLACPQYLGAQYPAFDALKVNERNFSHDDRAKYASFTLNDKNVIEIEWVTQGGLECDELIDEMLRCLEYNLFHYDYDGTVEGVAKIYTRDYYPKYHRDFKFSVSANGYSHKEVK